MGALITTYTILVALEPFTLNPYGTPNRTRMVPLKTLKGTRLGTWTLIILIVFWAPKP